MKTIILPGYSLHNKIWAYKVKDNLKLGDEVVVHEWRHWESSLSQGLSISYELEQVKKKMDRQKVNIIAKSVGTRVAMNLILQIPKQINKLILCGIPTRFETLTVQTLYKKGLSTKDAKDILIVQNSNDPLAPYSVVEKFVRSVNPKIKIVEKPASTHDYPYFKDFKKFLSV